MIRLPYQDGYLLIPQAAHAWLSGQLARHWGNGSVDRPDPLESVVLAVTHHDVGWLEKDGSPLLNEDGQPLSFLEPDLDLVEGTYERCVTHVIQIDPYAALLVNRHIQTIYNSRAIHGGDPLTRLQPLLDNLKQREQTVIEILRNHPQYQSHIREAMLYHNYRILRTCDLLSLFVCGAFPAMSVSDVPMRYGNAYTPLDCELVDSDTLTVSPWLFDQPEITVPLQARYIPQTQFSSQADYEIAFHDAAFVTLTKTLTRPAINSPDDTT